LRIQHLVGGDGGGLAGLEGLDGGGDLLAEHAQLLLHQAPVRGAEGAVRVPAAKKKWKRNAIMLHHNLIHIQDKTFPVTATVQVDGVGER